MMKNLLVKGYTLGIIGSACYGTNPLFALPLFQQGMDANSILFYRYLFSIGILGILMAYKRISFKLNLTETFILIVLGLLFSASSLTLFNSYNYMDAGIASTILFLYPVMVSMIMTLFFHEHLSKVIVLAILVSILGITLLYNENGENSGSFSLYGVLLVILSSLFYAIYFVLVKKAPINHFSPYKLSFYCLFFGLSLFVVRTNFLCHLSPVAEPQSWINILALAFIPTVISLIFINYSINSIGPTITSIFGALEPVTALFFGVTIFHEVLTLKNMIGVLLILFSVTAIILVKPLKHALSAIMIHHKNKRF